jgi:hypothetical protein
MEKLNITQGKWEVSQKLQVQANVDEPLNTSTICQVFGKEEDHATLIADAGNAYNTAPILPSELLKQNKELLEALELTTKLLKSIHNLFPEDKKIINKSLKLLKNATNA